MARLQGMFAIWFAVLLLFFASANLAGVVRPMGLVPFRFTGFPFTFAAWGTGVEEFFDWQLLALNCLIGIVGAVLLAGVLAWVRRRSIVDRQGVDAEPGAAPDRGRKAGPGR